MSEHRGILIEIEGCAQALVNSELLTPTANQARREVVLGVSPGLASTVDPDTGVSQLGGANFTVSDLSFALQHLKGGTTTALDGDLNESSTTVTVLDTTGFDSSGVIWVGREAILYDTKTSTQFQNCTRGYYRTSPVAHASTGTVYSYNPFLLGRQVWMYWQAYADSAINTLRWTGYLESVENEGAATTLTLVSPQKLINDAQIASPNFAKGTLQTEIGPNGVLEMFVEFANKDNRFFQQAIYMDSQRPYVRIDNELIKIKSGTAQDVYFQEVNAIPTQVYEVVCKRPNRIKQGDLVDFVDALGVITLPGVRVLHVRENYPSNGLDTITHTGDTTSLAPGDKLINRYKQRLTIEQRGMFGTLPTKHEEGADVQEVRVIQGDQVDLLFAFLFSVDGNQSDQYDILPEGWGLGLDSSLVDTNSFEDVRSRTTFRRYLLTEPLDLMQYLTHFAVTTYSVFVWQSDGTLKCKRRSDLYPQTAATTVNNNQLVISSDNGQIPQLTLDGSRIANLAKIEANYNIDGQSLYSETVVDSESFKFYGNRPLPGLDDKGIVYIGGVGELTAMLEAILLERKDPYPLVACTVLLDLDRDYEPGDLVQLTVDHLPDMEGTTGFSSSDTFEILEVQPQDDRATVELTLLLRRTTPQLCRIAPAALVSGITSLQVTVEPNSNSDLTASTTGDVPLSPISGEDGTEPVHYFYENDKVQLIDASTLTSATPTTASATVSSVDYATRTLTLDAVPGWLAAGDIVCLDTWDTTGGGSNAAERQDRFMWIADTNETLGSGGDDPFLWGR